MRNLLEIRAKLSSFLCLHPWVGRTMEKVQNKKDQNFQQVSIVMPVYNERNTIETIVERVQSLDIPKELIIIDDGSTDGTREWLN